MLKNYFYEILNFPDISGAEIFGVGFLRFSGKSLVEENYFNFYTNINYSSIRITIAKLLSSEHNRLMKFHIVNFNKIN